MSKVVHPYAHRLVILRDWKSRWFATDKNYVNNLQVDVVIREYLDKRLRGYYVSSVDIERGQKQVRIIIRTSRPGMVIGRSGEGAVRDATGLISRIRETSSSDESTVSIFTLPVSRSKNDFAIPGVTTSTTLAKQAPNEIV